jgi:hypothetical protein
LKVFLKRSRVFRFAMGSKLVLILSLALHAGLCGFALAQEPPAVAPAELLQKLRQSGARVQQISSAEPAMEINFQLAPSEVNDASLSGLEEVPNLIWLNLAETKISDEGLKTVGKLKDLERLHLEKTGIGDEGLPHLAQLEKLTYLNLYGTKVTDSGLMKLANLKQLRRVYVWQSQVSDGGIAKLREALPECRVIGEVKLTPAAPPVPPAEPAGGAPAQGEKAPADQREKGGNSQ